VTGRSYREALRDDRCWDAEVERVFVERGEPLVDVALQNREELIGLCEWIERARIRSYLEIGVWTGRLVSILHRLFQFDLVAVCDHGWAERCGLPIAVPKEAVAFWGDSGSRGYAEWRAGLGQVDLVLIDGDHRLAGVARDFAVNRAYPHEFLAFHDICGARRQTRGVARFWSGLVEGRRHEIVRPHLELGLDRSTMGIGIWSSTRDPAAT
jgi:hypothetical protein